MNESSASLIILLLFLVFEACLLAYVWSLYIRRFHDLGKSGWYSLLMLIPIVNFVLLCYLLFAKGDEGANAFGESNVGQPFWASITGRSQLAAAVAGATAESVRQTIVPYTPHVPVEASQPALEPSAPQQPAADAPTDAEPKQ